MLHDSELTDGRLRCTFSRLISVLSEQNGTDLNLNRSYYIMIGMGDNPGKYV